MTDPPVTDLAALLTVRAIGDDLFVGARKAGGVGRVFGGQVVAQALQAAQASVAADRIGHSLHANFLRPGREDLPVRYRVAREFDGASFSARRVAAVQGDVTILILAASFQRPHEGLCHADPMPAVPPPEACPTLAELARRHGEALPEPLRRYLDRQRLFEIRPVDPAAVVGGAPRVAERSWLRAVEPLPGDPALHRAAIAYVSDLLLLGATLRRHGRHWTDPALRVASLDHALWLHAAARADDWLLYATESPWAGSGRGFNRGAIYAADGRLVASVAQEAMIRPRQTSGST